MSQLSAFQAIQNNSIRTTDRSQSEKIAGWIKQMV